MDGSSSSSSSSAAKGGAMSASFSVLDKIRAPPSRPDSLSRPDDAEDISLTTGKVVPQRRGVWCLVLSLAAVCMVVIGVVVGVLVAKLDARDADRIASLIPWVNLKDAPVKFLVIGDWGRDGAYNQSLTANAMGVVANTLAPQFVVSTGDNFFEDGLHNVSDPQFSTSFTNVYSAASLQVQWFVVLGNNDYHISAAPELDPALKARDSRWLCESNFRRKLKACLVGQQATYCQYTVELFFLDTSVLVEEYWETNSVEPLNFTDYNADKETAINYVLNLMRDGLESSDATWKIVIGHHPVYSTGEHGGFPDVERYLVPMFEDYDVDLYINGHENNLEFTEISGKGTYYVTSGAGSMTSPTRSQSTVGTSLFYYDLQGFVAVSVLGTTMDLSFYDSTPVLLYNVTLAKQ